MLSLYTYFDLYGFGSSGRFSTYVRMIRNLFENLQEPLANARVQGAKFFLQYTVANMIKTSIELVLIKISL